MIHPLEIHPQVMNPNLLKNNHTITDSKIQPWLDFGFVCLRVLNKETPRYGKSR